MAGETGGQGFDRVWRPGLGARVSGWVIAGIAVLLAVSALGTGLGGGVPLGGALLVVVVNAVVAVAAWRWGSYPLLGASDVGLTVRNPLRTIVIPWDDIAGARASSLGLTVARSSGEQVVAWAVTRSAASSWLGRPSRADEVIAYLAARVFGEGPEGPGGPEGPEGERPDGNGADGNGADGDAVEGNGDHPSTSGEPGP